ncbi:hypothetical protein [Microbacterium sp. No. 7]|uniref:hypothetical protein n=1 Tax=Microbacterium sp. No. 7 TaxID=1714373 RepID=UPI0006D21834|nr:hypothetical protein [Microbacterium sp. No. 7]ALJ22089.1 hypothetical protein AOA12_20230 [Microbacterium sp. No. 7]
MSTYLYRAVNTEDVFVVTDWEDGEEHGYTAEPGEHIFGRMSGYLSRSGARDAGLRSGHPFEVIRSEPVVFLTAEGRKAKRIAQLEAELAELRGAS